jgi:hypothetical protein
MSTRQPGYFLKTNGCVIVAKFWGEWDIPLDIQFMDALGRSMQDMREWSIPTYVSDHMQPAKTNIERRNQRGECWLFANEKQGAFLLPLFESLPFDAYRTKSVKGVEAWLEQNKYEPQATINTINDWHLNANLTMKAS